jgi:hypothetical protein
MSYPVFRSGYHGLDPGSPGAFESRGPEEDLLLPEAGGDGGDGGQEFFFADHPAPEDFRQVHHTVGFFFQRKDHVMFCAPEKASFCAADFLQRQCLLAETDMDCVFQEIFTERAIFCPADPGCIKFRPAP